MDCPDQCPWKAHELEKCPSCGNEEDVTAANRFGNMQYDENGNVRNI
jgi:hypothetical protein